MALDSSRPLVTDETMIFRLYPESPQNTLRRGRPPVRTAQMTAISVLHFTDLHLGTADLRDRWPSFRQELFDDLAHMSAEAGPWDLVVFTGDFVQQGKPREFDEVRHFLQQLWSRFEDEGSTPRLVTVPGNHDILRPPDSAAAQMLQRAWPDVRRAFWGKGRSEYRKVIARAFKHYEEWSKDPGVPSLDIDSRGVLPGDFSATFVKHSVRLGILGLNTTFLQLSGSTGEADLVIDPRQVQSACDPDLPSWAETTDTSLLLTHHPPSWLSDEARRVLEDDVLYPPERFCLHLCGHLHDPYMSTEALGGAQTKHRLQGASLFGFEGWGAEGASRIHGYTVLRFEFAAENVTIRIWPRLATRQPGGGLRLNADTRRFSLARGKQEIVPLSVERRSPRLSFRRAVPAPKEQASRQTRAGDRLAKPRPREDRDGREIGTSSPTAYPLREGLSAETRTSVRHAGPVTSIAFTSDGGGFVSAGRDKTARLWDLSVDREVVQVRHASLKGYITDVDLTPDGHTLATASADGSARVWSLPDGAQVARVQHMGADVNGVAFLPSEPLALLTASDDKTVKLSELVLDGASEPRAILTLRHAGLRAAVTRVAVAPDGAALASVTADGVARVWDLGRGRESWCLGRGAHDFRVTSVAYNATGDLLATGGDDGIARIWDIAGRSELMRVTHAPGPCRLTAVVFDVEGARIAAAGHDGCVRVWKVGGGRELLRLDFGPHAVLDLAFSPDGTSLGTADDGGNARVWSLSPAN